MPINAVVLAGSAVLVLFVALFAGYKAGADAADRDNRADAQLQFNQDSKDGD